MFHNPGLFPEPDAQAKKLLNEFESHLNKVAPLKAKHRADLAYAIRDLSRSLTEERENRTRDYMSEPRSASAYLRYFMPWNLYRLTRLFQGLNLNIPDNATIVDLGAGPLTAILALWIARPHQRDKNLTFVCLDRTPKPMKIGLDLFKLLAPNSPWKISVVKGGVHTKLREKADLLMSMNTLNELEWRSGDELNEQIEQTARSLTKRLAEGGRILLVEPGVRDASRILSLLRKQFIDSGFSPIAPCTHINDCPMPGDTGGPWCHFRFEAYGAPEWLKKLTAQAKLTKQAASLSFLYFTPSEFQDRELVRVISESFAVPEGRGQYGCSGKGLVLLGYRRTHSPMRPGSVMHPRWPKEEMHDEKSGAVVLPVAPRNPERQKRQENEYKPNRQRPNEQKQREQPFGPDSFDADMPFAVASPADPVEQDEKRPQKPYKKPKPRR